MAAAPTVASQMVTLSELFNTAGANDSIRHYLAAKKISTTPTLALIAKNAEDFTTMIVAPFLAGVTIDGQEHKAEAGDEPVATAIMIHLFVEARRQWDIFSQAYWHKSAWTIAMALRNSTSFGEAVKSVMNDVATWQEIIIANAAPPRRPPQLPPADPNASTEEYDDQGAGSWGGGNRRKRRRPGKPKGKGRDGKDQEPPKKTDAANQQDHLKGHEDSPELVDVAVEGEGEGSVYLKPREKAKRPPAEPLEPPSGKKVKPVPKGDPEKARGPAEDPAEEQAEGSGSYGHDPHKAIEGHGTKAPSEGHGGRYEEMQDHDDWWEEDEEEMEEPSSSSKGWSKDSTVGRKGRGAAGPFTRPAAKGYYVQPHFVDEHGARSRAQASEQHVQDLRTSLSAVHLMAKNMDRMASEKDRPRCHGNLADGLGSGTDGSRLGCQCSYSRALKLEATGDIEGSHLGDLDSSGESCLFAAARIKEPQLAKEMCSLLLEVIPKRNYLGAYG
ncbi:hypothetical protein AK812_SmicGene37031 [Symbiodinium microadriaticum]|uniref:Uncharacterized protein n=1 Tax=Symbiodinium microadriaticum TaxID=2951 RepID=A0A1Q9CHA8_SYMMI|nr:hypothetical protein AK812_SmicGene37031 [Symbiodinium microadriaticum]